MNAKKAYQIRALVSPEDMQLAEDLQIKVWPGSQVDVVPAHILLAISKNGGVALGAFDREQLVGFVIGFLGTDEKSPDRVASARLKGYSHMLGIHPDHRGQGLGYQLKVAQRSLVLSQGVRLITWTYDPLLSLNAHLNIRRLGAVCQTYIRNAYGEMRDELNRAVASDRFEVDWWITSKRVATRIEGSRGFLDLAKYLAAGAQELNFPLLRDDGLLHPGQFQPPEKQGVVMVEIPADFQALRVESMDLAHSWREQTREIFEHAFEVGYIATDFLYLRGETYPRSYYVLTYGKANFAG